MKKAFESAPAWLWCDDFCLILDRKSLQVEAYGFIFPFYAINNSYNAPLHINLAFVKMKEKVSVYNW